jgi:hypothetical protein
LKELSIRSQKALISQAMSCIGEWAGVAGPLHWQQSLFTTMMGEARLSSLVLQEQNIQILPKDDMHFKI